MQKDNAQENQVDLSQILGQIFGKAENIFDSFKEQERKDKLNVLIIGGTGVGKSTLINTVFGKEVAKVGDGAPVTQKIQKFSKDGLCIYDSKGLEKNDPSIVEDLKELLDEQQEKEANEQIHIAWLCISEGNKRVEPAEKELYNLLKQYQFPTIVVITKAMENKNFDEIVRNELKATEVIRIRSIPTILDEGYELPPKNIKELVHTTYLLLPEAQQNALARKQVYDKKMKKNNVKKMLILF